MRIGAGVIIVVLVAGVLSVSQGAIPLQSSRDEGRTWTPEMRDEGVRRDAQGGEDGLYVRRTAFGILQGQALSFGDVDDDSLQEMYAEDYPRYAVECYEFDEALNYTVTQVLEYGLPWVLEDLNGDGAEELLLQRGDPGFGGNGYLDVYTWQGDAFVFIQRFTFPGMKTVYHPTTCDLESDGYPEVIFTTNITFSSQSYVRVASWDFEGDTLALIYTYYLLEAYGGIGAADFDQDGLGEFAVPTLQNFALFASDGDSIHMTGYVGETIGGSPLALAWDVEGNGDVRLLLGTSLGFVPDNWRFEVHRAVGDNAFELETTLVRTSEWAGMTHAGTGDTDRDGREEALLAFYPRAILFEWRDGSYDSTWALHLQDEVGTPKQCQIPTPDLGGDSYAEWVFVDHRDSCMVFGYDIIPSITIALDPDATVVPRGGALGFEAVLTNQTSEAQTITGWSMATLPGGNPYGPLLGPRSISLGPGQVRTQHFTHPVPGNAPLGMYTYRGNLGEYSLEVWESDSFAFEVIPASPGAE